MFEGLHFCLPTEMFLIYYGYGSYLHNLSTY